MKRTGDGEPSLSYNNHTAQGTGSGVPVFLFTLTGPPQAFFAAALYKFRGLW